MRRRVPWLVVPLLLGSVSTAHASHTPPDTLFMLSSLSLPAIALDPSTGDRHVAYLSSAVLTHSWEVSGVWQSETIADSASLTGYTGFDLRVAPDGDPVAAYVRKGTFVCARREGGTWEKDTLDTGLSGPFYPIALALHPATGEPAVAWARAGTPSSIHYARHEAGTWVVQQVDTVSSWWLTVALGLDAAGRPHLAWGRPRADAGDNMTVLTYAMGAGPDGSFSPAPVDSELGLHLMLEMDRSNGEPRLAYSAGDYEAGPFTVRYAFRGVGGAWQHTTAFAPPGYTPLGRGPALALDPAGNPFISFVRLTPIGPNGPQAAESCGSVDTGDILVYSRAGGAGFDPFVHESVSDGQQDAGSGLRAIASNAVGVAIAAWRSPRGSCPPIALSTSHITGPSLVGVGYGPVGARLHVTPNPLRSGEPLQVSFVLARGGDVSVAIHDIAGRLVARTPREAMDLGGHTITWQPPDLEAGLYWLRLRGDGAPPDARPIVVLP
jgi:hypothetical protein